MESTITIDPRFFANAVRDYANPIWAFVREVMQNAMDSNGCSRIDATAEDVVDPEGHLVRVTVKDNGAGMDQSILETKLLALGGTGKGFANGKIGGFGKAKELLFFAQAGYRIYTNGWRVIGHGGSYTLQQKTPQAGCTVEVDWSYGGNAEAFHNMFIRFTSLSAWGGMVYVNGTLVTQRITNGSLRRETDYGRIYATRSLANTLIVRVNGVPMFSNPTAHKLGVIVELKNGSTFLTANRDSLCWPYSGQLTQFLTELCVDKRSALYKPKTEYQRFQGASKIAVRVKAREVRVEETTEEQPTEYAAATALAEHAAAGVTMGAPVTVVGDKTLPTNKGLEYDFVLKNNMGIRVPKVLQPGSFGGYAKRLLQQWTEALISVHTVLGHEDEFSVGFILDTERLAEHEFSNEHGRIYYLNPVTQGDKLRKTLKPRFGKGDQSQILALAVHEVVHGMGYKIHDEDYATKLTVAMGHMLGAGKGKVKAKLRSGKYAATTFIRIRSRAHKFKGLRAKRFDLMEDGMTVAEYKKLVDEAGLYSSTWAISLAVSQGLITLDEGGTQ